MLSQSASCWMVLTSVGSSSEWGLLCIIGCRGRWEATCWSLPSSFSLEVKSWVIASSPSAEQANGEVACLEDILLQKKETAWIQKDCPWKQKSLTFEYFKKKKNSLTLEMFTLYSKPVKKNSQLIWTLFNFNSQNSSRWLHIFSLTNP